MGKRHTLKGLVVDEISLVDAPANPGAVTLLYKRRDQATMDAEVLAYLKRNFSDDARRSLASSGAALPDGSFPIEDVADLHNAIKAVGRASDPAKARDHIKARAKTLGAESALPEAWKRADLGPLDRLLTRLGIAKRVPATEIDPDTYSDAAADAVDKATDALGVSIASILADTAITDKAPAIQKSLAEFRTHLGDAVPDQIEKAMRDVAQAAGVIEKDDHPMPTIEELSATVEALTKRLADAEAAADVNKMSDKHKAFAAKLEGDAKAKFAAKTADERDKQIDGAAGKDDNDGDEKEKAEKLAKALAHTEALEKRLATFEAEREVNLMKRRAVEIGVGEAQAEVLLKASQGDATAFGAVLDMLKAANAQARVGGVFKEFGSTQGGGTGAGARGEIEAMAETLTKADPTLSIIQARVAVRKTHTALAQRERDEERAAIRAVG
jgi:hypothetical protein